MRSEALPGLVRAGGRWLSIRSGIHEALLVAERDFQAGHSLGM